MSSLISYAPQIALLFFFTVFVVIAVRTYRPAVKQKLQEQAFIPLKEEHHG